jgi:hypothetical protein
MRAKNTGFSDSERPGCEWIDAFERRATGAVQLVAEADVCPSDEEFESSGCSLN